MKIKKLLTTVGVSAFSLMALHAEGISAPTNLFDGEGAFYTRSSRYTSVKVNGTDVPVMDGYNRQGDYLEYDVLRYTSAPGKNTMTITCPQAITSISVSPKKLNIALTKISDNSYSFEVPDPAESPYYLYATINGSKLVIARDTQVAAPTGDGVWNVGKILTEAGVNPRSQAEAKQVSQKFQEAIDAASSYGTEHGCRGVVYVPDGVYYLANIVLKSNVELFLDEGSVLRATDNKSDYNVNYNKTSLGRDGTWWISTLNDPDNNSKNVKISGRGVIDANGYYYQKRLSSNKDRFCITALHLIHADNVEVDGITVMQTPMWGTMVGRCNDVNITNVKFLNSIDGNENDCIDVMESRRVIVDHSIGLALDDPYSTKTWMGQELFKNWAGVPEQLDDVTFDHCVSWSYCGAFKMGHGAQQKQSNVKILNGVVLNSGRAIGIEPKYANTEINVGGYSDILVENVDIENAGGEGWLKLLAETPGVGNPPVKNVTLRNINIRSKGSASSLRGADDDNIIDGVTFDNIILYGNTAPVTSLAELNITNTGYYRNVTFAQGNPQAESYLLEAEYFNEIKNGSVALFNADNLDPEHGGAYVQNVTSGNYIKYNNVDFGSNTASMTIRTLSKRSSFEAVLRIDSPEGPEIGRGSVARSASWTDNEIALNGAVGTHDLYVVFNKVSGPSSAIDAINYMRLNNRSFVNLESINVAAEPVEVNIETSVQLTYNLVPENAYQTEVSWSLISGEGIVALDKFGVVKGLQTGEATVRVSSVWNPEIYADIKIEVVDKLKFVTLRVEAEAADALYDTYHYDKAISAGGVNDPEEEGAQGLNSCWHTNFAVYENVDFLDGAVKVNIRKGHPRGSMIELWIDPEINTTDKTFTGGTKIAEVEFPAVATDWTRWATFEVPVAGMPKGVHTLVMRFMAGGGSATNQNYGSINWLDFTLINDRGELVEIVPVESEVAVNINAWKQLEIGYVPSNTLDREVEWSLVSATPEGAIELTDGGMVKGVKEGSAVVRATSKTNADIFADINVTVEDKYDFLAVRIEAEDAAAIYDTYHYDNAISIGDIKDPEDEGGRGLNSCWHTNFAVYPDIDFNDGAYSAVIRKGYVRGSKMEMWIDPEINAEEKTFTGGTLIGTVEYPKPEKDDWSRWQTFETPIMGETAGVHTLVLRFLAGGGSATNQNFGSLNWIDLQTMKKKPESGVENVAAGSELTVTVDGGAIVIASDAECDVRIYAIDGRIVREVTVDGGSVRVEGLASGIYIVNGVKVAI